MDKILSNVLKPGISAFVAALLLHGAAFTQSLPASIWKGTLSRSDGNQIVFNFETRDSAGKSVIYVLNAGERLLVDSIRRVGDSLFVEMPFFDSGFRLTVSGDSVWQGVWVKNPGENEKTLPFRAVKNVRERFPITTPPNADISGRWSAEFSTSGRIINRIGEFKQEGSRITGTFIAPSGDLRFLEGVVSGDSLMLSTFDGGNALLISAKIDDDNSISNGWMYSGFQGVSQWSAVRNDQASLPDEYSLTKINEDAGKLNFRFREMTDGRWVSITDKQFKNKVVIITIMGSWCPNCMDETKFLSDYYGQHRDKGLEVIALAYELSDDFKEAQRALQPFKNRFNIQYPVLITGVAITDSLLTEKTIPQIDRIRAYPTTIFVDRKGDIRKVHTGFDGPATGEHHERYLREFNKIVSELLNED